ncbi:ATP-binding protein [Actinacidiphila alni]
MWPAATSRRRGMAADAGFGLAIVAAVAAAHGGTVTLKSRPGDTAFIVTLPAAVPHPG